MRRAFPVLIAILLLCGCAQEGLKSFEGEPVPERFLNVYRLYPSSEASRVRAPWGYRPVYLTHYGRHGSRYVKYDAQYGHVRSVLASADSAGALTETGRRLWEEYSVLYPSLEGRTMNLTPLGLEQHRGIATRMVRNFPQLFTDSVRIEAVASMSSRTVQSMDAFCDRMLELRPDLSIERSSTEESMSCLNPYSPVSGKSNEWDLLWNGQRTPALGAMNRVAEELVDVRPFCERLFLGDFSETLGDGGYSFMSDLYYVAIDLPNTPLKADLCRYFTLSELEGLNCVDNFMAYCYKGRYNRDGSTGRQWALGWWVISDIVEKTVSDLRGGDCDVRLRFGHDGCLMAVFSLLGLEPWGCCFEDNLEAARSWDTSLTPMACNLQLVFFRNRKGDTLVRLLYNEKDFDLPLKKLHRKFYRAEDLLEFCLPRMEEAKKILDTQIDG